MPKMRRVVGPHVGQVKRVAQYGSPRARPSRTEHMAPETHRAELHECLSGSVSCACVCVCVCVRERVCPATPRVYDRVTCYQKATLK